VLATPVLAITLLLIAVERVFQFGFFNPALGGDPVLFQHLFWFYSHPAVYIMVLPAMGVVSELVAAGCRKPVFGYPFVAIASLSIAVLGFLVWGHHMFVAGESVYSALIFSILSFLVAIPSAVNGLQLDRDDVSRRGVVGDADALLLRLHRALHDRRAHGAVSRRRSASTYTSPTRTSSSRTSTTSWSAGRIMGYLGGLHFWWPKISGPPL